MPSTEEMRARALERIARVVGSTKRPDARAQRYVHGNGRIYYLRTSNDFHRPNGTVTYWWDTALPCFADAHWFILVAGSFGDLVLPGDLMREWCPGLHAAGSRPSVAVEFNTRRCRMYVWGQLTDVGRYVDGYGAIG